MYCFKCGNELRDGAKFCDKCGAKLEKSKKSYWILGIAVLVVGLILIGLGIYIITVQKKTMPLPLTENPKITVSEVNQIDIDEVEATVLPEYVEEDEKEQESLPKKILSVFEGDAKLELPSLVTYSKNRMTLGNYIEDKSCGGFVQYFEAGDDKSVVQCIAEYKDMVASYGLTLTGTLSSAEDGYNYTCYLFTYSGDANIKLNSINFNDAGLCDLCFVTAVKDDNAYIAAYVPDGVTFIESSEHMRNSY